MWCTSQTVREKRDLAIRLIQEHGENLTWEQAQKAVLSDTMEMAHWSGLQKSGFSPCEALKRLKFLVPKGEVMVQISDTLHFFRQKSMPGQRGPYAAKVLDTFEEGKPPVVTVRVSGPMGGEWVETDVPIVDDPDQHEDRCCVIPKP